MDAKLKNRKLPEHGVAACTLLGKRGLSLPTGGGHRIPPLRDMQAHYDTPTYMSSARRECIPDHKQPARRFPSTMAPSSLPLREK